MLTKKIRKTVSGKRRRLPDAQYDLDLSYITQSVVAMSFPASTRWEKLYRNDINSVAKYLDTKHPNSYFIYNMSNRDVDRSKFHNQEIAYPWEDHHSPSIKVLFEACEHMFAFLKQSKDNVVVVNCNAGKGRTGTCISSFLIYSGLADNFVNAITYYGWQRFTSGRGVS